MYEVRHTIMVDDKEHLVDGSHPLTFAEAKSKFIRFVNSAITLGAASQSEVVLLNEKTNRYEAFFSYGVRKEE